MSECCSQKSKNWIPIQDMVFWEFRLTIALNPSESYCFYSVQQLLSANTTNHVVPKIKDGRKQDLHWHLRLWLSILVLGNPFDHLAPEPTFIESCTERHRRGKSNSDSENPTPETWKDVERCGKTWKDVEVLISKLLTSLITSNYYLKDVEMSLQTSTAPGRCRTLPVTWQGKCRHKKSTSPKWWPKWLGNGDGFYLAY